jgi:cytidine deaminase
MEYYPLSPGDEALIAAAAEVIQRNFRAGRHSVGAAVLCGSGKIYVGVNIKSCGYGPCAEPIAVGAAVSGGERALICIVAVKIENGAETLVSPCGNCRQLLSDYAPDAMVLLPGEGGPVRARAGDLLPTAYRNFD